MQNAALEDDVEPEIFTELEKIVNQWAYEARKHVCLLQFPKLISYLDWYHAGPFSK